MVPCVRGVCTSLFLQGIRECAHHVERTFRPVIGFAIQNGAAAGEGIAERHAGARRSGKSLGHHERLCQEPLQTSCTFHDQAVSGAQFLDSQKRDDAGQFPKPCQRLPDSLGGLVVRPAHHQRIEQHRG